MKPGGWVLMIGAWSLIGTLFVYCLYKVMSHHGSDS